jgi:replicative DNA helicase
MIGCAILNPETIDASRLVAEHFLTAWGRGVWRALTMLVLNDDPVNEQIVAELAHSSLSDVVQATDAACNRLQAESYGNEIRAAAFRRRLMATLEFAIERLKQANSSSRTCRRDSVDGAEKDPNRYFFCSVRRYATMSRI